MSTFMISPEKHAEIAAAIVRARANVIPWDKLRDHGVLDDKPVLAMADKPDTTWRPKSECVRFDGDADVVACVSFEEQPTGIVRHLSVSAFDGRKMLIPPVVAVVARAFGIIVPITKVGRAWVEEYAPGKHAVNLIVMEVERPTGGNA